jgi:hypothetical protein
MILVSFLLDILLDSMHIFRIKSVWYFLIAYYCLRVKAFKNQFLTFPKYLFSFLKYIKRIIIRLFKYLSKSLSLWIHLAPVFFPIFNITLLFICWATVIFFFYSSYIAILFTFFSTNIISGLILLINILIRIFYLTWSFLSYSLLVYFHFY